MAHVQYFPLLYRLKTQDSYLIWVSNDSDFVVVDAEGFVLSFSDVAGLRAYADENHYSLQEEEPLLHDLDWVAAWTRVPDMPVDCTEALAAWNLFADVARSVPAKGSVVESFDSQPVIYNKLFWGNNLPSMTPKGRSYVPEWTPREMALLAEILRAGLNLFETTTRRCR